MTWSGAMLLPDEDDLTFMPMAVRRALDRTGLRVSLRGWQALSLPVQTTLVALGGEPVVATDKVRELVHRAAAEPIEATEDPPADRVPAVVAAALDVDPARWASLHPVARHALDSYARRDKPDKLRALYEALTSDG